MINNGMHSNEDLPDDPYLEQSKELQDESIVKDKNFTGKLRKILISKENENNQVETLSNSE
jgi:hypothetical protein